MSKKPVITIKQAIERVVDEEPLFTAMVYSLTPIEDKEGCPTLGTDGENLYYNPDFLNTLTLEEAAAVVLHEVMHCAFQHIWRRKDRDMMKWNIATDYAINGMVNESFKLPKGCLLSSKYIGMSAEKIYEHLPDQMQQQSWCEKHGWEGQDKDNKDGKGESVSDKLKKAMGMGGKRRKLTKAEEGKIARKWEKMFEDMVVKEYGKLPATMQRVVEESFYRPVIDWTSLIQNILSEDITDYSFSVPDRRFLETDFTLPDMFSYDRLKDVVFAYDTSGSINEQQLFSFYMETLALFNNFASLSGWIGICDAMLHNFAEITPQNSFKEFNFRGGGGTSFTPVFDEIRKRGLNPRAVFYFTDCQGEFPREKPTYPVYWLVRADLGWGESPRVPFGKVILFQPKDMR